MSEVLYVLEVKDGEGGPGWHYYSQPQTGAPTVSTQKEYCRPPYQAPHFRVAKYVREEEP